MSNVTIDDKHMSTLKSKQDDQLDAVTSNDLYYTRNDPMYRQGIQAANYQTKKESFPFQAKIIMTTW